MFDNLPETVLRKMAGSLADTSFDAITVTRATSDEGSKILHVNEAFTELTGYAASDVIGTTPGVLQGSDTDPDTLKRLEDTVARGETFHGKATNYRKDGTPFTKEWKVTPVGNDGTADYYLAVQREAG